MLAFDHPFRNQGIDRGFRQAGRNAAPRSISRAIIDKRGPVGADIGQKLLTKAVEPGCRQIALASQLVHIHDNLFERADRAFQLPMPELPFQCLDFLVDDREDPAKDRPRADDMVGDLLHGPDFHRQVKPVDNMCRWFWQRLWQPLHDFRAIGENRDLSVSGITFELEGLQRPRPHFKLGSVARREIVTRRHPSSAATATRNDDFKVARRLLIRASDMSGIDADDKLAQGIILSCGHAEEALTWTRAVMAKLGLTLNEAKTSVKDARTESFDFLGYSLGPRHYPDSGRRYLGASPSKKSVQQIKAKVSGVLTPGNKGALPDVRTRLNRLLGGWSAYFSYGSLSSAYQAVDDHVYDRVRSFLCKRHKEPGRGTKRFSREYVYAELGVLRLRRGRQMPPPCALR